MENKVMIFIKAILFILTTLLVPCIGLCSEPVTSREALMEMDFGPDINITSCENVAATDELPAHIRVEGYRMPDDGFIIKLPINWNERLYQTGNGGAAGMISEPLLSFGLKNGYASVSGSGGHRTPEKGFQFGYPPDDSEALEKIDDYCFGSVHETNILARKIIKAFYGAEPTYAYYNGYSTGGRQGLMEAQRFPDDFNGIIIGSPPIPFTMRTMADNWVSTMFLGESYIPIPKLSILARAVMDKCDSIDGVADNLIEYPPDCDFNAVKDLPPCQDDIDSPDCFTKAQRETIYNIYEGIRGHDGERLFKGPSFGSEGIMVDGKSGWTMMVPETPGGDSISLRLGGGFVQWIGLPPGGGGPDWDWRGFNVENDWKAIRNAWSNRCDTYDPNLRIFKLKGGKLIQYHGWSDPLCWPAPSVDYYDRVVGVIGSLEETKKFYKLYMVPGMTHFPGGYGVFDRDTINEPLFKSMVEWVENGIEPDVIVGDRKPAALWNALSRPVCPYPESARYFGKGDINNADNFMCVTIIPAQVFIEPKNITMGKEIWFKALITCPEKNDVKKLEAVICQGASGNPDKIKKIGQNFKVSFETKDLLNIKPGGSVCLTVTAFFEKNGEKFALEGRDTVMIIE